MRLKWFSILFVALSFLLVPSAVAYAHNGADAPPLIKTIGHPSSYDDFDPFPYDIDHDGVISKFEALTAVTDYFNNEITKADVIEVLLLYFMN